MNAESHEVACNGCERHDESRKINLAEHVRVFDERFARLVQTFRKVSPEADACKVKQRLRKSVCADFCDAAEYDHEHDCGHNGLDKEPQRPENGLLVPCDDIALDEHAVKVSILPKFLEIYFEEARLRLDDRGPFARLCRLFLRHVLLF